MTKILQHRANIQFGVKQSIEFSGKVESLQAVVSWFTISVAFMYLLHIILLVKSYILKQ